MSFHEKNESHCPSQVGCLIKQNIRDHGIKSGEKRVNVGQNNQNWDKTTAL